MNKSIRLSLFLLLTLPVINTTYGAIAQVKHTAKQAITYPHHMSSTMKAHPHSAPLMSSLKEHSQAESEEANFADSESSDYSIDSESTECSQNNSTNTRSPVGELFEMEEYTQQKTIRQPKSQALERPSLHRLHVQTLTQPSSTIINYLPLEMVSNVPLKTAVKAHLQEIIDENTPPNTPCAEPSPMASSCSSLKEISYIPVSYTEQHREADSDSESQALLLTHNSQDSDYDTGDTLEVRLIKATQQGDSALVQKLCNLNANPNMWLYMPTTSIYSCKQRKYLTLQEGYYLPLFIAITHNQDSDLVAILCKARANPDLKDSLNNSPLSLACRTNNATIIKVLLDAKASVNMPHDHYRTALMIACATGDDTNVQLLLSAHADPNRQDDDGRTALTFAVLQQNNEKIINLLLTHQADPNIKTWQYHYTPLMEAASMNNASAFQLLLEAKADPLIQNKMGMNALIIKQDD